MKHLPFTRTLLVEGDPKQVFEAICNVRGWWSETVTGETAMQNGEFDYRQRDLHYSRQRLEEIVPNERVVWLVTESQLTFVPNPGEWTGTRIRFEIEPKEGKTQLRFVHEGLTPEQQCFDACSAGWDHYLGSLRQLIETGEGQPDRKPLTVDC